MNKPFRILFVDDQPEILTIIERTLAGAALEVLTAASGEAALAILTSGRVDVLVTDLDMPGMSGLELLARVRLTHPRTLRMLLTGKATLERAVAAINDGEVARLFSKPFDPTVFRATIETLAARIERLRAEDDDQSATARLRDYQGWLDTNYPGLREVRRDEKGRVIFDEAALRAAGHEAVWRKLFG